MQQALELKLSQGLIETLGQLARTPGQPVHIASGHVAEVDKALDATIQHNLADIRERERSPVTDLLKLRVR